jgi:anti-sigma regulatory factor (Ser/Thr protein kinase)
VEAFTHPELDYAIAELVENAIEHAESTPRVRVDATETDGTVEISIRDNCPPIPAEERYVITDRWEMDDLRHTGGMGLWLVYWVAKRSGGDLSFDTHSDGNVVTLAVPNGGRAASGAERRATEPPARPRTAANRANGGGDAEGVEPVARRDGGSETGDGGSETGDGGSETGDGGSETGNGSPETGDDDPDPA